MIIGIAGNMNCGKSTVADIFKGEGYQEIAFADNLKEMAMSIFGLSYDQVYTQAGKMKLFKKKFLKLIPYTSPMRLNVVHIVKIIRWITTNNEMVVTTEMRNELMGMEGTTFDSPRRLLQWLGTEMGRDVIDEQFNILVAFNKIQSNSWKNVLISDCRFANEREYVKGKGGKIILIKRSSEKVATTHLSENDMGSDDEYDYIIQNDGTLQQLKNHSLSICHDIENHDLIS